MKQLLFLSILSLSLISCKSDNKKSRKDKNEQIEHQIEQNTKTLNDLKIAFYVLDSVAETFEVYKQEMDAFEKEGTQLQNQLNSIQKEYETVYTNYETGVRQQTLTPNQIASYEQRLGGLQQKMSDFQNSKMAAYQQKQLDATKAINNKITKYSEEFAQQHGIHLFLVAGLGSQVAYADSSMDMTIPFVDFMNEKEKKTK